MEKRVRASKGSFRRSKEKNRRRKPRKSRRSIERSRRIKRMITGVKARVQYTLTSYPAFTRRWKERLVSAVCTCVKLASFIAP